MIVFSSDRSCGLEVASWPEISAVQGKKFGRSFGWDGRRTAVGRDGGRQRFWRGLIR